MSRASQKRKLLLAIAPLAMALQAVAWAEPPKSGSMSEKSVTPAEFDARMDAAIRSGRWIELLTINETDAPERAPEMDEICITPELQAAFARKRTTPITWMVSRKECTLTRLQFDDPAKGPGQFHMSGRCSFPGTEFRIKMDGAFGEASFTLVSQTTTLESGKAADQVQEHMSMVRQGDCAADTLPWAKP